MKTLLRWVWIQADGTSGGKFLGRSGMTEGHYDHVHAKVKPGVAAPGVATAGSNGYDSSGLGMSGLSGDYSSDKMIREAQQKVGDTDQAVKDAESKLERLRTKPGVTPEEIAAQERKVAKAKREHVDATNDLAAAQDKYNTAAGESPDGEGGFSGKDFMGGIAEFFGFDGTLFKNPAEFGLFKFLGAFSKLKPKGEGGEGGGAAGGGGGGIMDTLAGIAPAVFGPLNQGSPQNAPGQFMPTMPSSDSSVSPLGQVGPPGTAGPGNQPIDNSININNPVGQDHLKGMFQQAESEKYPRMRQPLRALPVGGG
jgi:hypothetical protein